MSRVYSFCALVCFVAVLLFVLCGCACIRGWLWVLCRRFLSVGLTRCVRVFCVSFCCVQVPSSLVWFVLYILSCVLTGWMFAASSEHGYGVGGETRLRMLCSLRA